MDCGTGCRILVEGRVEEGSIAAHFGLEEGYGRRPHSYRRLFVRHRSPLTSFEGHVLLLRCFAFAALTFLLVSYAPQATVKSE